MNHIYSVDESGLALFKIDEARLNLHYINESWIGKSEDIVITAVSSDPANKNKTKTCTETMKVFFAAKEDMKLYETGY